MDLADQLVLFNKELVLFRREDASTCFAKIPRRKRTHQLFEHMPDVLFFAKDENGRLFWETIDSSSIVVSPRREIVGSPIIHLPQYMADKFAIDDQAVLHSGKPLLQLVELFRRAIDFQNGTAPISIQFLIEKGLRGLRNRSEFRTVLRGQPDPVSKVVGLIKERFDQS